MSNRYEGELTNATFSGDVERTRELLGMRVGPHGESYSGPTRFAHMAIARDLASKQGEHRFRNKALAVVEAAVLFFIGALPHRRK